MRTSNRHTVRTTLVGLVKGVTKTCNAKNISILDGVVDDPTTDAS